MPLVPERRRFRCSLRGIAAALALAAVAFAALAPWVRDYFARSSNPFGPDRSFEECEAFIKEALRDLGPNDGKDSLDLEIDT